MFSEMDRARRGCLAFEAAAAQSRDARINLDLALETFEALGRYIEKLETAPTDTDDQMGETE